MSWTTIIWSMNAAACLTLAAIHLLVWWKQRENWVYLAFSVCAVAGAGLTAFEFALLRVQTTEQYGVILRWAQLPVWLLVVSLVIFVRLYFRAGRLWLAWSACGFRTLALILNFVFTPNLSYREITHLNRVSWWGGETVSIPIGVTNPWILIAQLSSILLIVFLLDTTITAWRRRGEHRRALVLGWTMIVLTLLAAGHALLVVWGVIHIPFFACFPFLGLLAAMGYELSYDLFIAKKVAEKLELTNERMNLALEAANLGLWEWNFSKDELWSTKVRRALIGLPVSGKITLEDALSRVHADDRDRVRQIMNDAARTGKDYHCEYRILYSDGSTHVSDLRGRCGIGADGKTLVLRGIARDVTKRKQAQELFRLATEASPSGIILVNAQGKIVLVNSHVEELFGYNREELIGKLVEILVPERFTRHSAHREAFVAHPEARMMGAGRDLFGRRKDGSEFPVEIGLNPIQTPQGTLVLATVIDITARKTAEEQARKSREQIDRLTRISLLGEMTATIAHELNQPLSAIVSNANAGQRFLDRGELKPEVIREILQDVGADARRGHDVINHIRNTIKKGAAVRERIDLNEVVNDVAHSIRPDARIYSCEIETLLAKRLPEVEGDPVQIRQVLINLVSNAFDAMADISAKQRKVEIKTERNGDGSVCVSVRDHGVGIRNEARDHLFEQFFTTKEDGLGMGLAIVRSIIETHGGQIAAENVDGDGARFYFTLPTVETDRR